ncbi:MAG: imidazole glycerol phosphate synthase subunit HisH [Phototrophicaceae bacterium]
MLAVVDYGAGNLRSVMHALKHLNAQNIQLVQRPEELAGATKIILPGVGAFGSGMQKLHAQGLVEPLQAAARAGLPFLGICVGMQFLFEVSEEMGEHQGLGLLEGKVVRFPARPGIKVPHMGWNQVQVCKPSALVANLPDESYTYFVHSYYCAPSNSSDVLLTTEYGQPFAAAVQRDNLYGLQFHPEKSQRTGLQILKNFLEL